MTEKLTKKQELAERKLAREALKAAKKAALDAALAEAHVCLVTPKEIGEWGVVRTRCWAVLHDKLRRQTNLKKLNTQRLQDLARHIRRVPEITTDECNQITNVLKG